MSDTGSGAPRPETARDAPSALSAPTGTPMAPQAAADDPAATALPPDVLLIVAVPDMVLFPGTVFPVAIGRDAGLAPQFQVGEPWWWIADGGRICAYDAATTAALGSATRAPVSDAPS